MGGEGSATPQLDGGPRLLKRGRNCGQIAQAERASVLVDAAAYFSAFRQAAESARHSILIAGWDFERRLALRRGEGNDQAAAALGPFLDALVRRRRSLHIHLLIWDFAMIYAMERELFPIYHLGWKTHRRLHLHLDDSHPPGASLHQKIVVIDDKLGFAGGIDLTSGRWDTPEHKPHEPRRSDPDGKEYGPFHDLQMMVEGPAAAALGDLLRERWKQATGKSLKPPRPRPESAWPRELPADFADHPVAIARTRPAYRGGADTLEIERLYLDAIAAARSCIYVENQYLSARRVVDALAARLAGDTGPEIVLVLPREGSGWLEHATMGALRRLALADLEQADRHGRLAVYYPAAAEDCPVYVHSKLLIVDDRLLTLGSANLSNRSMGLDAECNLALEAGLRADDGADDNADKAADAIARIRDCLVAEHLHCAVKELRAELAKSGSLLTAIESLRGDGRSLQPLCAEAQDLDPSALTLAGATLLDPERPVDPADVIARYVPPDAMPTGRSRLLKITLLLTGLVVLASVWRWTPLGEWLDPENMRAWIDRLGNPFVEFAVVMLAFALGGLVFAPVTALIVGTGLAFGPVYGFLYAHAGVVVSAAVSYLVGELAGRDTIRRLSGARINQISQRLAEKGVLAVIFLRIVPVAPYSVINLAAGASHISLRDFLLGTLIGMLPASLALTFFAGGLFAAVTDPAPGSLLFLALGILLVLLGVWWLRAWLRRRNAD